MNHWCVGGLARQSARLGQNHTILPGDAIVTPANSVLTSKDANINGGWAMV
jgi:hypothetical protein